MAFYESMCKGKNLLHYLNWKNVIIKHFKKHLNKSKKLLYILFKALSMKYVCNMYTTIIDYSMYINHGLQNALASVATLASWGLNYEVYFYIKDDI